MAHKADVAMFYPTRACPVHSDGGRQWLVGVIDHPRFKTSAAIITGVFTFTRTLTVIGLQYKTGGADSGDSLRVVRRCAIKTRKHLGRPGILFIHAWTAFSHDVENKSDQLRDCLKYTSG